MQREHPFYSSLIRVRSELKFNNRLEKEFEKKLIYYGYHPHSNSLH